MGPRRAVPALCAVLLLLATSFGSGDARKLAQAVDVGDDYIEVDLASMNLQDKLPDSVTTPVGEGNNPLPNIKAPEQFGGNPVVSPYPATPAVPGLDQVDDSLPDIKLPSIKSQLKGVPVIGGTDESAQSVEAQGTVKAQGLINFDSDSVSVDTSNLPKKAPAMPASSHTRVGAGLDSFINSKANSSLPLTSPSRPNFTAPELTDSDLPNVNVKLPKGVGGVLQKVASQSVDGQVEAQGDDKVSAQGLPLDYIEDYDGELVINMPGLVDKIPDAPRANFSGTHLGWVHDPRANHTNDTVVPDVPRRPDYPNISIDSDMEVRVPFPDMHLLDGLKDKINAQAVSETPVAAQDAADVCAQGAGRSYRVQAASGPMSSVQAQGACEGVSAEGEADEGYSSARWTEEEMGCDKVSVMSTLKESVGSQSVYTGHQTAQGQCVMVRAAKDDLVFKESDCEESAAGVLCRQGTGPEVAAEGLYQPRTKRMAKETLHLGWPLGAAAALLATGYLVAGYVRKRQRLAEMQPASKYGQFQLVATAPVPLVGA